VDKQFHLRQEEKQSEASGSVLGDQSPITLKQLKVTRPPNTYLLQISYRSADRQLAADAANSIAQSYLEHTYTIRLRSAASVSSFMERQMEELRAKMERSGQALAAFERELNVINPEEKTNILASRLLQLNTEYTAAQGERLKKQAGYESVKGGSIEAALATQQGDALRKLDEHRNEAREHFARWPPISASTTRSIAKRRPSWPRSSWPLKRPAKILHAAWRSNSRKARAGKAWPGRR
jgi:uncharacterized protein involved in exopolysaccharide biosynthesis